MAEQIPSGILSHGPWNVSGHVLDMWNGNLLSLELLLSDRKDNETDGVGEQSLDTLNNILCADTAQIRC